MYIELYTFMYNVNVCCYYITSHIMTNVLSYTIKIFILHYTPSHIMKNKYFRYTLFLITRYTLSCMTKLFVIILHILSYIMTNKHCHYVSSYIQ